MSLKEQIQEDLKSAMRARDKERVGALRLVSAAIKQREVDERLDALEDTQVLAVLEKMLKQRRESIRQYSEANREDLADQERFEASIIEGYMPAPLEQSELSRLIDEAIASTGASGIRDMGKVMGLLKAQVQGRADMGAVSAQVKARLSA